MHGCQQGGGGSGGVFVPSGKLLAKREKLEGGVKDCVLFPSGKL